MKNKLLNLLLVLFTVLITITIYFKYYKILFITIVSFLSIILATLVVLIVDNESINVIPLYGFSSGLMIMSACLFLLPQSFSRSIKFGGIGLGLGIIIGYIIHTLGHLVTHKKVILESNTLSLTVHSILAGVIIGFIYNTQPEISLILGIAIVSHKGPAGYNMAQKLVKEKDSIKYVIYPAIGIGLGSIPTRMISYSLNPLLEAFLFAIATGIFIHLSMDFLPNCEKEEDIIKHSNCDDHAKIDKYRFQASLSTFIGGILILFLWLLLNFQ